MLRETTEKSWFTCLWWHPARKRIGLLFQPGATRCLDARAHMGQWKL